MTKSAEANVVHTFLVPAVNVFDAWLNVDLVRLWMKDALKNMGLSGKIKQIEIDPQPGGRFLFSDMRDTGVAAHWGSFLIMDRPLKLVFTWFTNTEDEKENNSVVTLIFEENRSGCAVTITHTMDAKYAEYVSQTENGWATILKSIAAVLARN